jgi:pimeloyl-ACP methyl ester carboxylesterase
MSNISMASKRGSAEGAKAAARISHVPVAGSALELAWWSAGGPEPPIALLHEGLGSVALWRNFPEALGRATGRPIMAYSRFGHGASAAPRAPHTISFMHEEARLLPAILDATGIGRAILFGHSDGGSIALIAAAEHPERVRALILEAPHVFVEEISLASIKSTTHRYRTGDLRDRLSRYHDQVDTAFFGWSDMWLNPAFRDWNIEEYLPRVSCPALLIQGRQDQYGTLRQIDAIERQVCGPVERLVLDECGHAPHRDQPAAVLDAVTRFLNPPHERSES